MLDVRTLVKKPESGDFRQHAERGESGAIASLPSCSAGPSAPASLKPRQKQEVQNGLSKRLPVAPAAPGARPEAPGAWAALLAVGSYLMLWCQRGSLRPERKSWAPGRTAPGSAGPGHCCCCLGDKWGVSTASPPGPAPPPQFASV